MTTSDPGARRSAASQSLGSTRADSVRGRLAVPRGRLHPPLGRPAGQRGLARGGGGGRVVRRVTQGRRPSRCRCARGHRPGRLRRGDPREPERSGAGRRARTRGGLHRSSRLRTGRPDSAGRRRRGRAHGEAGGPHHEPAVRRGQGRAVRPRRPLQAAGCRAVCPQTRRRPARVAEAAVARGADLLGMAGGDGSLAIVASIASLHGLPFVVVPAGTRNHFALDLGIDREDVPGRAGCLRRRSRHAGGPGRDQRARVRQQRVDGCVRQGRAVGGLPRREGADRLGPAARHARTRGQRPRPALHAALRRGSGAGPAAAGVQQPLRSRSPSWRRHARAASTAACSGSSRCESARLRTQRSSPPWR